MVGDREMVLAMVPRRQPEMAPRDPAAASSGNHLIADQVKAKKFGKISRFEVTADGVPHRRAQGWQIIRLRHDRGTERPGGIPAFGGVLNEEYEFGHDWLLRAAEV